MAARQTGKAEDTGQHDAAFDLDAWLGQASRPEREVVLYSNNAVQADIDRLERERAELVEPRPSGSWGAPEGAAVDTSRIDKQLGELRKRLAGSGITFRVRSLDSDDEDRINKLHPMPRDATTEQTNDVLNARFLEQMACQVFEPQTFTVDQLRALRKGIGEPEFMKLFGACQETRTELAVSSPFWRGSSGSDRN